MTTRNKVKLAILVLVCVCLIVYALSWLPKKVSLEYPYVEYHENDETHVVHGTMRIEGKYSVRFLEIQYFRAKLMSIITSQSKTWIQETRCCFQIFTNLVTANYT